MRLATTSLAAMLLLLLGPGKADAETAEGAFGIWQHPENGSHVEMAACGADLCAKIVKITDAQAADDKNPDPAKRARPIIGLPIMDHAKRSGDASWEGDLYNRLDGKTYSGTITVTGKDSLELKGCTLVIFCKTVTWTRVK